ncbi:MAG: hypothetical protein ACKVVP_11895, partial [Chloroflexota bacterium]
ARVWDAASGREIARFDAHTGPIMSVAFASDGARVVSAGSDGTARVWDATSGRELLVYFSTLDGWVSLDAGGQWRGEGSGLEMLGFIPESQVARDAAGHATGYRLEPVWLAADLPALHAVD